MAIRVEHQPSPVAVGTAAYMAGRGRARQREQKQLLDLQRDRMLIQARREEQFQNFGYRQYLENMRQGAYDVRAQEQRGFQAGEAEKNRLFQEGQAEKREEAASQSADERRLEDWYNKLTSDLEVIIKESGGFFANPNDPQSFGAQVKKLQADIQRTLGNKDFDPSEVYKEAIPKLRRLLDSYKPDRDVVPLRDRPNAEFEEGGWIYRNTPDGPVRVRPLDEQGEIQKTIIPFTPPGGGPTIYLQPKVDRNGNRIPGYDPIDLGQQQGPTAAEWNKEWGAYYKGEADWVKQNVPEDATPEQIAEAKTEYAKIFRKPFQDQQPPPGAAGPGTPAPGAAAPGAAVPGALAPRLAGRLATPPAGALAPGAAAGEPSPATPPAASPLAPTMGPHGAMVGPSPEAVQSQYDMEMKQFGRVSPETQKAFEAIGAQQAPPPAAAAAGGGVVAKQPESEDTAAFRDAIRRFQAGEGNWQQEKDSNGNPTGRWFEGGGAAAAAATKFEDEVGEAQGWGAQGKEPVVLGTRPHGTPPPRPGRPGYETWMKKVDAEYERLPSGTIFVDPDGKRRRKP